MLSYLFYNYPSKLTTLWKINHVLKTKEPTSQQTTINQRVITRVYKSTNMYFKNHIRNLHFATAITKVAIVLPIFAPNLYTLMK